MSVLQQPLPLLSPGIDKAHEIMGVRGTLILYFLIAFSFIRLGESYMPKVENLENTGKPSKKKKMSQGIIVSPHESNHC